jgi:ABC-type nitrate/sulfonate/bicarbonate transport system permease component
LKKRAGWASTGCTVLVTLVLWEVLHRRGFLSGRWPSLLSVVAEFGDPGFREHAAAAAVRTGGLAVASLGTGLMAGALCGIAIGLSGRILIGPYHLVNAVRSVPITVLMPVFLGTFGLRHFLLPMIAVPVGALMASNLAQAIWKSALPRRQVIGLLGFGRWAYLRHVVAWEAADAMVATLRVVVPLALAIEVAIDFFMNANSGLGSLISQAYHYPGRESEMFAGIIMVAGAGVCGVIGVDTVGARVMRWKQGA